MKIFASLALSGLCCVSLNAWAAEGCPTAADDIATDRPDVTNSSVVVPYGSLQIENGLNVTREEQATVIDGTNTRLRFGVSRCTELLIDLPNGVYSLQGGGKRGFSDLSPAVKTQLGPLPGGFDLSATIGVGLPTGAVAVSGRGYQPYSVPLGT